MNRCVQSLMVPWVGAALVWSCPARGQTAVKSGEAARAEAPKVINLQFPGGTIGQYVLAIRETAPEVNVVLVTPEGKDLALPPIQLSSVDIGSAMELIEGDFPVDQETHVAVKVDEVRPTAEGGRPIYRVTTQRRGHARSTSDVHVWTIADLLTEDTKADAVLTAVETAVGLLGTAARPAEIRFHEATAVLIAFGTPTQLEAIDRVIAELRTGAQRKHATADDPGESIAGLFEWIEHMKQLDSSQLVAEIGKLREDVQTKENRIRELERRLAQSSGK